MPLHGHETLLRTRGGEWINPAEIEDIVGRHPTIGLVAVIGRKDAKWGERPVLVIEPRQGEAVDPQALIAAMPLAASGKIDKNPLRADYANGKIGGDRVGRRHRLAHRRSRRTGI